MKPEFLKIVYEHQGIIHKVCRLYRDSRENREDLFQEIMYQLWRSFPAFKGEAKVSTWIYKIALSTAVLAFRSKKEKIKREQLSLDTISFTETPQNDAQQEQIKWLYAVIATLDPVEKAIVTLYLDEYSYKDIAAIVGITENHVGVKLSRIKSRLKELSTKN